MKTITRPVVLTDEEKAKLLSVVSNGKPKEILHSNILLMSDKGFTPKKISEALSTSKQTVNTIKQHYFKEGIERCLVRKNAGKAPYSAKITGEVEAKVVALACTQAPQGKSRWALQLLADKAVELKIIDSISHESINTILKKHNLSLT